MSEGSKRMRGIGQIEKEIRVNTLKVETHREAIQNLQRALEDLESLQVDLDVELKRAKAAADSNAYPVGTRVRHSVFTELTGTVVESDGTGVAVHQTESNSVTYGFNRHEWIPIEG